MQRWPSRVKPKDANGNEIEDGDKYEQYTESDMNNKIPPCGGTKANRVHFDGATGMRSFIYWKTMVPDDKGNCTMRLGTSMDDAQLDLLLPDDKSANAKTGKFPCGRSESHIEGKHVRWPKGLTCDQCFLQLEWETKLGGKQYMCADIEILGGKIEDCSGQCMNGGVCLNGACKCRKGFSGQFCQVKEFIPDNTNYTKYLKYSLVFVIMIILILLLSWGASILFKKA